MTGAVGNLKRKVLHEGGKLINKVGDEIKGVGTAVQARANAPMLDGEYLVLRREIAGELLFANYHFYLNTEDQMDDCALRLSAISSMLWDTFGAIGAGLTQLYRTISENCTTSEEELAAIRAENKKRDWELNAHLNGIWFAFEILFSPEAAISNGRLYLGMKEREWVQAGEPGTRYQDPNILR